MNLNELKEIVQQGENYKIEFKESIDKTFVEEVTAFANASGGKIFLGVTDDGRYLMNSFKKILDLKVFLTMVRMNAF